MNKEKWAHEKIKKKIQNHKIKYLPIQKARRKVIFQRAKIQKINITYLSRSFQQNQIFFILNMKLDKQF